MKRLKTLLVNGEKLELYRRLLVVAGVEAEHMAKADRNAEIEGILRSLEREVYAVVSGARVLIKDIAVGHYTLERYLAFDDIFPAQERTLGEAD